MSQDSDAPVKWIPVTERLPASGVEVLACYRSLGGWHIIRAHWAAANTVESGSESDIGEYDEATDQYYDPQGWYEQIDNWDTYSRVTVIQGEISHWMPMPAPPAGLV